MRQHHGLGALVLCALVAACEPATRGPGPATTPQSTTVATTADGRVVALDADHDAIVVMNLDGSDRFSIAVGKAPVQLALRGERVVVSNRADRTVSLVDLPTRSVVKTVPVGVEPYGVAFIDDVRAAVVLGGENAVVVVDLERGVIERTIALPDKLDRPRAIAVLPDGRAYVSHLLRGQLSVVNLARGRFESNVPIELTRLQMTRLNASLVGSLTLSPGNDEISAPHVNLNNEGIRPSPEEGGNGYLGTPDQLPAVNPTVTTVDVRANVMTSDATPADDVMFFGCFDCGAFPGTTPRAQTEFRSSALLSARNGSLTGQQMSEPVAVAYLDGGRGIAVLGRGSRNVLIWRRDDEGKRQELVQVTGVGHGADGLAATPDGLNLVVHNAFDLTINVVTVPPLESREEKQALFGRPVNREAESGPQTVPPAHVLTIADATLPDAVQTGRRLFFDATTPSMTNGPGVTCATCHAEGRNDGRTWTFIDGPRNTPSLAGAAEGRTGIATTTAPLHWKGELQTHRQLQRTITEFMGGNGLTATQLDQLAAFIDTIPAPDNKFRTDALQLALQVRGAELFYDPAVGCSSCHAGEHFTDNQNHDVQTDSATFNNRGEPIAPGFQTPVLHGLSSTGPYLHDGSITSIERLLDELVRTDKMGSGSHLSDDDITALAAFLRTL